MFAAIDDAEKSLVVRLRQAAMGSFRLLLPSMRRARLRTCRHSLSFVSESNRQDQLLSIACPRRSLLASRLDCLIDILPSTVPESYSTHARWPDRSSNLPPLPQPCLASTSATTTATRRCMPAVCPFPQQHLLVPPSSAAYTTKASWYVADPLPVEHHI
jgi:hypothetical protein